jgi:DNA-binding MarR family transcriptional regulator
MHTHFHAHPHAPGEGREHFLRFIRQVSPEADPTSVMLFSQILRANNQLTQAAERNLGGGGLTWAKFRLLMDLGRQEHLQSTGMQPSELSDNQGISRNTISALLASLEADGLVSRELNETDRRKFLIRLTPEGRKMLKSKMNGQFLFVTRCFQVLDASERQTLSQLMARLNASLEESEPV